MEYYLAIKKEWSTLYNIDETWELMKTITFSPQQIISKYAHTIFTTYFWTFTSFLKHIHEAINLTDPKVRIPGLKDARWNDLIINNSL